MAVRNQISQNERESRVPLDSNLVIMRNWDLWWPFSTMSALMSRQGMLENGGSKNSASCGHRGDRGSTLVLGLILNPVYGLNTDFFFPRMTRRWPVFTPQ